MIRQATLADVGIIRELALATWPVAYAEILSPAQLDYMLQLIYSSEALTLQMQEKNHRFILLYEDEQPVGFASYAAKDVNQPHIFRLHKIYVLPTQQGKGSGQQLIDYVVRQAQSAGAAQLELNVNRNNPSVHFYQNKGFKILHEEDIDIGDGYFMNDYVMALTIDPAG